jgi:hypothetical protein
MIDKMVLHSWWVEQTIDYNSVHLFDSVLKNLDLKDTLIRSWRRHYFGGFDNFKDYEKYGDMFIPAEKKDHLK